MQMLPVGAGTILAADEVLRWTADVPDRVRKYNGLVRYSEGSADNGLSNLRME